MTEHELFEFINNNNVKEIRRYLNAHPQAAGKKDYCGWFTLHYVARWNSNPGVVRMILDAHPEAAAKKDGGDNHPLHYAAFNSNPEVFKMLLDTYPEAAKTKNRRGELPLHYAANWNENPEVVRMILDAYPQAAAEKDDDDQFPLHNAAHNPNKEVKKLLLKATLRVIRRPLSAKIIQRAWKECRYNPAYKMCERVLERGVWESINKGDTV